MALRTTAEPVRKPPDPKAAPPVGKRPRLPGNTREPIDIASKRERFARGLGPPLGPAPQRGSPPLPQSAAAARAPAPGEARPIQRQPAPNAQPDQPQVPPDVARQMAYAATVLRRIPELPPGQAARLDLTIAGSDVYNRIVRRNADRAELQELQNRPPRLEEMGRYGRRIQMLSEAVQRETSEINGDLAALHIASEEDLVRMVTEEFPATWMERGRQIANAMLDQNADVVRAEKARYAAEVCNEDTEGLRNADADLANIAREADDLRTRRDAAADRGRQLEAQLAAEQARARDAQREGSLPGGVPLSAAELGQLEAQVGAARHEVEGLQAQAEAKAQQLVDRRNSYGQRYPVLYVEDYRPGSFTGSDPDALKNLTGQWLDQVLENIEKTRGNLGDTVKIWDLRDVPGLAFQSLGVNPRSVLGQAVGHYIEGKRSEEEALHEALMALGLVAAAIAVVATAGGALLVAAAATGFTVGLTLGQLVIDIRQYSAESAASHVALDPLIADISVNDPSILPIVMDVIALGLEAVGVVGVLRSAARAAMATGDLDAFAAAARRTLPAHEAEELISRTARRLGQTGVRRLPGPYTTLATKSGGGVYSEMEMTVTKAAQHPDLPGLRASLQRVDTVLLEDSRIAAEADTAFVRVTGPDGQTFERAMIRYNPEKATLADLQHELNHLTDFRGGRIPPPYEVRLDSAEAFAQAQRRPVQSLLAEARAAGPRVADLPLPQAGEFQARKAVAEIRNSLRDIEEFVPRTAAGRIPSESLTYFEQQTRIIRRWTNELRSLLRSGTVPGRAGQALSETERAAVDQTVRRYVESQFPELPEEYARLHGGDFWAALLRQRNTASGPIRPSAWAAAQSDRTPGGPLPDGVRRPMERSFGQDFRTVSLHADARAGVLADGIHAEAFTRGTEIYFAPGKFQPGTQEGRRLLAHELTHVTQQRTGLVRDPRDTAEAGPLERQAERAADHVAAGRQVPREVPGATPRVQRSPTRTPQPAVAPAVTPEAALTAQIRQFRTEALLQFQTALDNADEAGVRAAGQFAGVLWTVIDASWQEILHPSEALPQAVPVTVSPTGTPAAPPAPPPPAATATPPPAGITATPPPVAATPPPGTPSVAPPAELQRDYDAVRREALTGISTQQFKGRPVSGPPRPEDYDGNLTVFILNRTDAVAWVVKDTAALVAALRLDPIPEADQWRAIGLLRQHFNPWEFAYMLAVVEDRGLTAKFNTFGETPARYLAGLRLAVSRAKERNLATPSGGMALFRLMTRDSSIELLQPLSPKELSTELFGDPDSWHRYLAPYNRSLLMGANPDAWLPQGTVLIVDGRVLGEHYRTVFVAAAAAAASQPVNEFHIEANPHEAVVPGNTVKYFVDYRNVAFQYYDIDWSVTNDPQAVREHFFLPAVVYGPRKRMSWVNSEDASWTIEAQYPGSHVINAALTGASGDRSGLHYTQVVMTAEEKTAIEFQAAPAPDFADPADLESALGRRARSIANDPRRSDEREQLQRELNTLREARRTTGPGGMHAVRAVYVSEDETAGQGRASLPLTIYVAPDPSHGAEDRGYQIILWDFTQQGAPHYTGSADRTNAALSNTLQNFAADAPYPTGRIRFEITVGTLPYVDIYSRVETWPTRGGPIWSRVFSHLATAAMVVGVGAAFLGQAEITIPALVISGILEGIAAGLRIADRLEHGQFEWNLQTGLDILAIATAIAGAGALRGVTATAQGIGRLTFMGQVARATGMAQIAVMAGVHVSRLQAAIATGDNRRIEEEITSAVADGALFLIVHRAGRIASRTTPGGAAVDEPPLNRDPVPGGPPPRQQTMAGGAGGTPPTGRGTGAPATAVPAAPERVYMEPGTPEYLRAMHEVWVERIRRTGIQALPDLPLGNQPPLRAGQYRGEFTDPDAALDAWQQARRRAPGREVGLYRNRLTGRYAVIVGTERQVYFPAGDNWEGVMHNHPNPNNVLTYRMPAINDVFQTWRSAMNARRPVTEFIEHDLPGGGRARTAFTVTPRGEVRIEYYRPDGAQAPPIEADSLADYQRRYNSRTIHLDPASPEYRELLHEITEQIRQSRAGSLTESGPAPPRESTATRQLTPQQVERAALEESQTYWRGRETDTNFARHQQNFRSIVRTLANKQAALAAQGRGALLPQMNEGVLDMPVDEFIRRTPSLRAMRATLERNPNTRAEFQQFLQGRLGAGAGLVGNRQPDIVEFFLNRGEVVVTDITVGPSPVHSFKTQFYREVLRAMLGSRGAAVYGLDINPMTSIVNAQVFP